MDDNSRSELQSCYEDKRENSWNPCGRIAIFARQKEPLHDRIERASLTIITFKQ